MKGRAPGKKYRPELEVLEDRLVLAAYTPQQVVMAYGIDQVPLPAGQQRGAGQTIALIEMSSDLNFPGSLSTFDQQFGLSDPPSFRVVGFDSAANQAIAATSPLIAQTVRDQEFALDVESAHSIAPGAAILVVACSTFDTGTAGATELAQAMHFAASQPGVAVVSDSLGFDQLSSDASLNSLLTTPAGHPGVTYFAAAGDGFGGDIVQFPSISPNVVAVGATTLNLDAAGNYLSETAWSRSAGGPSAEPEPAYQFPFNATGSRETPDVAFIGSASTGVETFDNPADGFFQSSGTSVSAPCWAALVAIADQLRASSGLAPLDGASQTLPALYRLPQSDFHQITALDTPFSRLRGDTRSSTLNPAYNPFTGRGSPIANLLVPQLAATKLSVPTSFFATGTDRGTATFINLFDANGNLLASFNPFAGTGFTGGVRVAVGDVTGDGVPDLVVGSGPGAPTVVLVYDGTALLNNPNVPQSALIRSFNPFGAGFTGGAFVAVGSLDEQPGNDIIVGADAGGGPEVNVYSSAQVQANQLAASAVAFFAYAPSFPGGVRVAVGDINGDGKADLVTAAGPGGGPQVNIYLGTAAGLIVGAGQVMPAPFLSFYALGPSLAGFTGGVYVAALDANGDGKADLFFGAGAGALPEIAAFNGNQLIQGNVNPLTAFFGLTPATFTGGVRVGATLGFTGSGTVGPVLLAAAGPGGGPQLDEFDALALFSNPAQPPAPFHLFNAPPGTSSSGLFVSA